MEYKINIVSHYINSSNLQLSIHSLSKTIQNHILSWIPILSYNPHKITPLNLSFPLKPPKTNNHQKRTVIHDSYHTLPPFIFLSLFLHHPIHQHIQQPWDPSKLEPSRSPRRWELVNLASLVQKNYYLYWTVSQTLRGRQRDVRRLFSLCRCAWRVPKYFFYPFFLWFLFLIDWSCCLQSCC